MAKRSEVLEKIRFFAKHGITLNRETIWQKYVSMENHARAVRREMLSAPGSMSWDDCSRSSTEKTPAFEQKTLTFGPRSGWIRV